MLSLVHLIYMAGDKCMRQNACCEANSTDKTDTMFFFSFQNFIHLINQ